MESPVEAVVMAEKNQKKGKLQIVLNFLMYGGWILVIGLGLAIAIAVDVYF